MKIIKDKRVLKAIIQRLNKNNIHTFYIEDNLQIYVNTSTNTALLKELQVNTYYKYKLYKIVRINGELFVKEVE